MEQNKLTRQMAEAKLQAYEKGIEVVAANLVVNEKGIDLNNGAKIKEPVTLKFAKKELEAIKAQFPELADRCDAIVGNLEKEEDRGM